MVGKTFKERAGSLRSCSFSFGAADAIHKSLYLGRGLGEGFSICCDLDPSLGALRAPTVVPKGEGWFFNQF
jgi:hypothetical protein